MALWGLQSAGYGMCAPAGPCEAMRLTVCAVGAYETIQDIVRHDRMALKPCTCNLHVLMQLS